MKYLLTGHSTDRLDFRPLTENDVEAWMAFCSNRLATRFFPALNQQNPTAFCRAWMDRVFMRYHNNLGGLNGLVERSTGRLVGQCGLLIQTIEDQQELEIGYSLVPQFWGRGFATEAARACRDAAFENQWADSLISIVHVDNAASARVAQANGMLPERSLTLYEMPVNLYRIHRSAWQNNRKK